MEALTRLATRRPVAVCVVAVAVSILGWTAWGQLPLDLLPDVSSPTIVVSVRSGDRPPAEMERLYAEQVEQRLFAVRSIRSIEQVARSGRLVATVGFDWQADMDFALVEVEKALGPLRSDPDVEEVLVRHFDPRQAPVLTFGLLAAPDGPDLAELRRIALRQVGPALERLQGTAEVRITGGREIEVRVDVDRARLEAHGLTLGDVESRLRAANVDVNAGTLEERGQIFLVRGLARFHTPEDVSRVVLRYGQEMEGRRPAVRVEDVASVRWASSEVRHVVVVDGREGVGLAVFKEAGSNTVHVSRDVRRALDGLRDDLPGVEVRVITDEAGLIEDAIADVESSVLIGIVLAVLVLIVFLRSVGPTVVVSLAVPVSLLATLFLMRLGDRTLNLMTLGGLALGASMLVDNAIVVVESIFRRLARGESVEDAAARGTADVASAVTASTLTICAVFLPILFVRGLAARLVAGLAFTVVVSLLASLLVALFLIPALAPWLLPRHSAKVIDPGIGRTERTVARWLTRPGLVVLLSTLLSAGAIAALAGMGSELLPPSDPRQFAVRLVGPPGMQVEATERVAAVVTDIVREAAGEDVEAVLSEVGRLPEDNRFIREEQSEENTARILVRLRAGGRPASQVVGIAARAVERLEGVEASWDLGTSALAQALGTSGPPIVVELYGESLIDLRSGADRVSAGLAGLGALWDVRSSFEGGQPELRVVLDRQLAEGLGIGLDTLTSTLEAALDGRRVTTLSLGDEEREVVLHLPRVRRDELAQLPLTTASGVRRHLGDVARLEPAEGAREIFRRDQRRVARVTARIDPGHEYPEALAAVRTALAGVDLPPGLRAELAGEEEERAQAFSELGFAGALALVLVFMILAATFESLLHPLTVASSVPLALIGVALVLVPLGRPLGVMEVLGLIVLAGVAVNDAILLVDAGRSLIDEGMPPREALARAAGIRLRPIVMNTATAVLALLPLALGTSESARLRSPLALTIIGGLVTSTVGSLYVVPCVYLLIERLRPRRART